MDSLAPIHDSTPDDVSKPVQLRKLFHRTADIDALASCDTSCVFLAELDAEKLFRK